jgi:hypothetical protein
LGSANFAVTKQAAEIARLRPAQASADADRARERRDWMPRPSSALN